MMPRNRDCVVVQMMMIRPKKTLVLPVGVAKNLGKGGNVFFFYLFFLFLFDRQNVENRPISISFCVRTQPFLVRFSCGFRGLVPE